MKNSDVLRSVRYLLNVSEQKIAEIIKLGGGEAGVLDLRDFLKKEEEEGSRECPHELMAFFLNGLIISKRGKIENSPTPALEIPITNNQVLKKLRVSFELKDEDIRSILSGLGHEISKSELSAFFRKAGHPNYRPCGDQFLRNFLKGLTDLKRK